MPNDSSDAVTSRLSELRHLQDVIESFRAHNVDPTEFAYLKGMLLFKTSECCALTCSVSQTRPRVEFGMHISRREKGSKSVHRGKRLILSCRIDSTKQFTIL